MNERNQHFVSNGEFFRPGPHESECKFSLYSKRYPSKKTFLNFPPYIFIYFIQISLHLGNIFREIGRREIQKKSPTYFLNFVVPKKNLFRNIFFSFGELSSLFLPDTDTALRRDNFIFGNKIDNR